MSGSSAPCPASPGSPVATPRPALPAGPYLVAGLGRAGRAAIEALERTVPASQLSVWDGHPGRHTASLRRRLRARGIRVLLRGHPPEESGGTRFGCIVKSPGIPPWAVGRDATVIDELELGWRLGSAPVVGITGTDGKTTTASLVAHVLRSCAGGAIVTGNSDLHEPYSAAVEPPGGWVVCEASSYQLECCPAFVPEVAVLTNLTHDHLHRHGSMAAYGGCKRRMFIRPGRVAPVAVINMEQPFGRCLARDVTAAGGQVLGYGDHLLASYRILACSWSLTRATLRLATPRGPIELDLSLPGPHNARNAAAAVAVGDALGLSPEAVAVALGCAHGPPGRFEAIDEGQSFDAIVDFAHTPAAITAIARTVRVAIDARRSGRLMIVAGAAGSVDPSKRAAMGRAARALADHLIVTAGNPRGEDPRRLVADVLQGALAGSGGTVATETDRRAAIGGALSMALPGDVVLILGRGAMTRLIQTPWGDGPPFDDRQVVREELRRALHHGAGS